jgi:hypothetical protein
MGAGLSGLTVLKEHLLEKNGLSPERPPDGLPVLIRFWSR